MTLGNFGRTGTIPGKVEYGRTEAAGFRLSELGYSPRFSIPRHTHAEAQFCFVLDGVLTEVLDSRAEGPRHGAAVLRCQRFDLSFKPARIVHEVESGPAGARILVVEIPGNRLAESPALTDALSAPLQITRGALRGLGLRLYSELTSPDEFTRLVIEGSVLELLADATRRMRPRGPRAAAWLEQVAARLRDDSVEPPSVGDLADSVSIDPRTLTRAFRQQFGCSIDAYSRAHRVRRAARDLVASDRPIAEIALATGFYDQSHFTRAFKRETGMTPAAYRSTSRRGGR